MVIKESRLKQIIAMAIERDEKLCVEYMKGREDVVGKVGKKYIELCEKVGKLVGIDEFMLEIRETKA